MSWESKALFDRTKLVLLRLNLLLFNFSTLPADSTSSYAQGETCVTILSETFTGPAETKNIANPHLSKRKGEGPKTLSEKRTVRRELQEITE